MCLSRPDGIVVVMTNYTIARREPPASTGAAVPAPGRRLLAPHWAMAARFVTVGASGYAVNVATFTLIVHATAAGYRTAGAIAFLTAVVNNFAWNRRWTFRARGGRAVSQAARFLAVSLCVLVLTLALLSVLAGPAGIATIPAEALATMAMTPLGFTATRLWAFVPEPRNHVCPVGSPDESR